jgi:hypothetical protein
MSFESHTFTATKVASHGGASVRHKARCDEPMRHNGWVSGLTWQTFGLTDVV